MQLNSLVPGLLCVCVWGGGGGGGGGGGSESMKLHSSMTVEGSLVVFPSHSA